MSTFSSLRPSNAGARRRRTVSTSGSSGIGGGLADDLEQRAGARRTAWSPSSNAAVTSPIARSALVSSRACTSASDVAPLDEVAALAQADDADRVVDRVLLRAPAGAEVQRGVRRSRSRRGG